MVTVPVMLDFRHTQRKVRHRRSLVLLLANQDVPLGRQFADFLSDSHPNL